MKNKIVLHVFANLNLGGAESRIVDLYKNINRDILQFHFLKLTNEDCYFDDEINSLGGEIYSIIHPRNGLLKNIVEYFKFIKINKFKYHAIHFHVSYYSGFLVFISRLVGVKRLIVHSRNQYISNNNNLKIKSLIVFGKLFIIMFASNLVAISKKAGIFLFSINKFIKRKFVIVPNAFELDKFFHVNPDFIAKFTSDFQIHTEDIVLGNISRLVPIKNQSFLIDIIHEAMLKGIPIKLFVIGGGDIAMKKMLMDKIKTLKLERSIFLLGQKTNVHEFLHCFNVTILPSIKEGLGVAALESQAAGVPCLLSNGVPSEADLGMNICSYLSLEYNDKEEWINEIIRLSKLPKPNITERLSSFQKLGFTIEHEIKMIFEIYGISNS